MPGVQRSASILFLLSLAAGPATAPVGSMQNPRQITSADKGPDIEPVKLAASPYSGIPLFRSFRSFTESSYATANVWVYAAHDDPNLYDLNVGYDYPPFYRPTWGELFDHVARQMRCAWSFDPKNNQFKFEPTDAGPGYGVALAPGWRREDRGRYVWHAPADQPFGMDIYDYGHVTADPAHPDLIDKVRAFYAVHEVAAWPNAPTLAQMTTVKVAGADALHLRTDTPRPGGLWRQWAVVVDGHAFVIVSAMDKSREADLGPAVDKMVASFALTPATTRPATTAPAR
jgi:hypothetical protein